ncbi:hypothetical protein AYK24_07090 [Thermoplasmatales archaeon SG8-52-4]|nr:MAG: hypothetical protein AYK24_07090 [Thermoplasmatales archaeon SG8-52-4]
MEKKVKVKLLLILVPLILAVSALSGCIAANAIQTGLWVHTNSEGTGVSLIGHLIWYENFHNWDGYIVYDTEFHDNWENYNYRVTNISYDADNYFHANIEGLDRLTEYHYRAVGEQKIQGVIRVGADLTFIPGGPRVIVQNPSSVGIDSAIIEGELTHLGGAASCEVYFIYGTDPDNLNLETTHETMNSTGNFNAELTNLSSCEKYYYRAVAINDADTWVSNELFNYWFAIREFTPGMPDVTSLLPHDVTETQAKFRGNFLNFGGTTECDVWFEFGDENPNNLDEQTDNITLNATGEFFIVWDGLTPDTTYWVRAVANNGICENRGDIKEFKTLGALNSDPYPSNTNKDIINEYPSKTKIIEKLKDKYPWIEYYSDEYPMLKRFLDN